MAQVKPHIVLVPGAWHRGDVYDGFRPYLEKAGYETTALTLPSVGANPPLVTLDLDVEVVRSSVEQLCDDGQDIVVFMWSAGGICGCSALKGLSKRERAAAGYQGGVVSLCFMTAWAIQTGKTVAEYSIINYSSSSGKYSVTVSDKGAMPNDPMALFYNGVDPEIAAKCVAGISHQTGNMRQYVQTYAAFEHIPSVYLFCTEDQSIPLTIQQKLVEGAQTSMQTFAIDSGHAGFLAKPEAVARVVRYAAGEETLDMSDLKPARMDGSRRNTEV